MEKVGIEPTTLKIAPTALPLSYFPISTSLVHDVKLVNTSAEHLPLSRMAHCQRGDSNPIKTISGVSKQYYRSASPSDCRRVHFRITPCLDFDSYRKLVMQRACAPCTSALKLVLLTVFHLLQLYVVGEANPFEHNLILTYMAEGVGFEPTDSEEPPVFKTGALDQLCDPSI